jgi:hypothetical protein
MKSSIKLIKDQRRALEIVNSRGKSVNQKKENMVLGKIYSVHASYQ